VSNPVVGERPVNYAAVGATRAPDLMAFPPAGYRPIERRARIGHGDARFEYAWVTALTWGIQRKSGFRIRHEDAPQVGDEYRPVLFDVARAPIGRATSTETVYGENGESLLVAGDTVLLVIPFGPFGITAPVRVVYVVDEPKRKGFAYGTLPGHPENGEESFVVDQRNDGSVWITLRAFSRPSSRFWWSVYPVLRLAQEFYTRRYLRALAGALDA
jgi:uncharacterized protein (UPF0548 family)